MEAQIAALNDTIHTLEAEILILQNSANDANHYIHSFVIMSAFIFAMFTVCVACYHVKLHDDNVKEVYHKVFKDKSFQIFCQMNEMNIPPIVLLPAVYAATSFVMLAFEGSAFGNGVECIEEIFEAISIWYFVRLFEHTMRFNCDRDFNKYVKYSNLQRPPEFKENDPNNYGLSRIDCEQDDKLVYVLANHFYRYRIANKRKEEARMKMLQEVDCGSRAISCVTNFAAGLGPAIENLKLAVYNCGCMVIFFDYLGICIETDHIHRYRQRRGYEEMCCGDEEMELKTIRADKNTGFERIDHIKAKAWLLHSRVYTRQFVVLRPIIAVLHAVIFFCLGTFNLDGYDSTVDMIFLGIEAIIMTFAFWVVEQFTAEGVRDILIDNVVEWKCFVFQMLVVYTFFQQIILEVFVAALQVAGYNVGTSADTIQYFLVIIEMLVIAVVHLQVFTVEEWQEGYREKKLDERRRNMQLKKGRADVSAWSFMNNAPLLSDVTNAVNQVVGDSTLDDEDQPMENNFDIIEEEPQNKKVKERKGVSAGCLGKK